MKDNINLPPFYVGQRVVCVLNNTNDTYLEGHEYIVKYISRCPKCGTWEVGCIEHGLQKGKACCICPCGHASRNIPDYWICSSNHFAPIESTFSAITLSEVIEIETPLICNN